MCAGARGGECARGAGPAQGFVARPSLEQGDEQAGGEGVPGGRAVDRDDSRGRRTGDLVSVLEQDRSLGPERERGQPLDIAYMVDQSHNIKGKVEAMIQTVTIAHELLAKALLVDQKALTDARASQDVVKAEEIVRGAFMTDTRPLIGMIREQLGAEPDALAAFRASGYEKQVGEEREAEHGAPADASYA